MILDAFSEFKYDPKSNRYRVVSGAGKGSFISKSAFLNSTERYIDKQKSELIELGSKLATDRLSIENFQLEATRILKELHVSQAILGANGAENMTANKYLIVARELKKQYYLGVGKDGKAYGIKHLTQDIIDGKVSEAQLRERLRKYAESSTISKLAIEREDNKKEYCKRILGRAEHCEDCIEYANRGIQLIGALPLPMQDCQCGANCKCSIIYLSLEEAVKEGFERTDEMRNDGLWMIFFGGRRTPIVVSAENRSEAISKARKKKKRGGDNVVSARQPNESERKTIASGGWVRTGANGEKPGESNLRGFGIKPKKLK